MERHEEAGELQVHSGRKSPFAIYSVLYLADDGLALRSDQVDGHGWSSRFKRLITSHSVIFKATIYEEWFADRIEPWVHYIPTQLDYSDLLDSHYFFAGDPLGRNGHPDLAKTIADAGYEWSLKYFRKEDMTAYMFR